MKKILFILTLLLISIASFSQEKLSLFSLKDSSWTRQINSGFNYYEGTLNKHDFTTTYNICHIDSSREIGFDGRYYTSFSSNIRTAEDVSCDIRYDLKPYNKLSFFAAVIGYRNPFRNYDSRFSILPGVKYTIANTKTGRYSISFATVYEVSNYTYTTLEGDNGGERMRASFRTKIKQKINKKLTLSNILFYKVTYSDTKDYSFESTTSLSYKISDKFNIGLQHYYVYDNKPLQIAIKKLSPYDMVFSFTLGLDF